MQKGREYRLVHLFGERNQPRRKIPSFIEVPIKKLMKLERQHFYRKQAQRLQEVLGSALRVLDVGSGVGYFADAMQEVRPEIQVVNTDVEDRNQSKAPFVLSDGRTLPFPDKSFEVITFFYVLHHIGNPQVSLKETKRVCRGKIIIQEDTWRNRLEKFAYALHVRSYRLDSPLSAISAVRTDKQWQQVFQDAGLIVVDKRRVHKIGYPVTRYQYVLEPSAVLAEEGKKA